MARWTGIGHALPPRVVRNADLADRIDSSDEWIRSRSGIAARHHVDPGTATSDLAVQAGARALEQDGGDGVDAVVLATTTPDRTCPATAPLVAARLGLGPVPAFDLNAVCSGFLYGLATANGLVAGGASVLLVAADTFSTIVDPDDRRTAFLFGDGAGAVVLRPGASTVHRLTLGSDGTQEDLIVTPGGGSREPGSADRWFTMRGQAVYRNAVERMAASTQKVLSASGWAAADVDHFVGHQANHRILDAVAARSGLPVERLVVNLHRVGNTAAASIPLAISEAYRDGALQPGQKMVLAAFGGGTTWGAATLTWPELGCRGS